jgi:signal transduction histidine kinase
VPTTTETSAVTSKHVPKWISPYHDYRFWLIQILNLISCIELFTLPSHAETPVILERELQSSFVLKTFLLFFVIAALSSGLIFGLAGAIPTVALTTLFLIPKLIQWSPLPFVCLVFARFAVIGGLSIAVAYLVSREKKVRLQTQAMNEKMKEIIREKDRYFKLASEAQENERKRISRDLHDDSLQLLATVIFQLDAAINSQDPEQANAQVLRAKETITRTTEAIRRYCEALRPLFLDTRGLRASVQLIGQELERGSGIKTVFDTQGNHRPIQDESQIQVFRVMQEAFHNIEKHSQATALRVQWNYIGENLEITVTDNGIGMWDFGAAPARSLGIQGMYERMELVGGKLKIESQPGFGTKVSLQIPFEQDSTPTS